ncbi:hypothetical protein M8C21_028704 [Ambrosia artemisiifolia]|uniref:Uncharacterized protein n=1 Tax=Ambrosia artemisiifolia TaxID=4212 RepID=A0AAD5BSP1_AMBAR|nr:hypothetical protein M8C21_028704 [Ambrosia artemisiifolia]
MVFCPVLLPGLGV